MIEEEVDEDISIHSLRVEGDILVILFCIDWCISIHSLRVEGDVNRIRYDLFKLNFNPLPPCGGRHYLYS